MCCLVAEAHAQDQNSLWRLRVMDMSSQLKVEATIRFSNEPAKSCMGGNWKRVKVETKDTQAEDFFPLAGPLAFKHERGSLTLGRTQVCDGYLFLTGNPQGLTVQGDYNAVGWGSKKLGSFSLTKIQQ